MFECWQDCLHPWDQCAPFLSSFDVANRANFRVWIRLSNEFLIDRIVASKRSEMAGTQRRNWRGRRIVRSPIGRLGYWVLHVSSKQCTMAASFVCVDVVPNENRIHWDAPGYGSRKGHLFTSQPTEVEYLKFGQNLPNCLENQTHLYKSRRIFWAISSWSVKSEILI